MSNLFLENNKLLGHFTSIRVRVMSDFLPYKPSQYTVEADLIDRFISIPLDVTDSFYKWSDPKRKLEFTDDETPSTKATVEVEAQATVVPQSSQPGVTYASTVECDRMESADGPIIKQALNGGITSQIASADALDPEIQKNLMKSRLIRFESYLTTTDERIVAARELSHVIDDTYEQITNLATHELTDEWAAVWDINKTVRTHLKDARECLNDASEELREMTRIAKRLMSENIN